MLILEKILLDKGLLNIDKEKDLVQEKERVSKTRGFLERHDSIFTFHSFLRLVIHAALVFMLIILFLYGISEFKIKLILVILLFKIYNHIYFVSFKKKFNKEFEEYLK